MGSLVALALVLWIVPVPELLAALARIPPLVWALALPLYLVLHLVGMAKWRVLVEAAEGGLGVGAAIRCYYYGLFGNTFLPSVVGGDVVRAGLAVRLARNPSGVVIGSVVDRTLDVLALATVAGLGVLLLPRALDPDTRRVFWVLLWGLAVAGVAGAAVLRAIPTRRLPYKLRRLAVKVRRSVRAGASRPGRVISAFVLAVGLQLGLVALNAWLGAACGIEIAFTTWLFAWPMAKLSALVPVTQGGLGVREAALAGLLAPFGVEAASAVAAGLVFQAVVFSGGFVGGGIAAAMGALEARGTR